MGGGRDRQCEFVELSRISSNISEGNAEHKQRFILNIWTLERVSSVGVLVLAWPDTFVLHVRLNLFVSMCESRHRPLVCSSPLLQNKTAGFSACES